MLKISTSVSQPDLALTKDNSVCYDPETYSQEEPIDLRKSSRRIPVGNFSSHTIKERRRQSLSLDFFKFGTSQDEEIIPVILKKHKITKRKVKQKELTKSSPLHKSRKLLKNSLRTIAKIRQSPHHPDSPRLAVSVNNYLSEFCDSFSLPLGPYETNEFHKHHQMQINKLEKKLAIKESEIAALNNKLIKRESKCQDSICGILNERLNFLDQEMTLLKAHFDETRLMKKKLDELFKLDEGDPRRSIENFYYMTLNKLTAFTIALQSLNSGLVAHSTSWKEDLVSQTFIYLNNISQCVGGAASFFFGAGAIIPLIALPFLTTSELGWEKYRDWKKTREFKQAATNLSGGLTAIEERNRNIAFSLTYLLQMQLRFCTFQGAETIVEDWISRLCYNLMKGSKSGKEDLGKIYAILPHIFKGKGKKHEIETHADRKWTTTGLFEKAGVAYPCYNEVRYETLYQYQKKINSHQVTSKSKKYGYLFFNNIEEATFYKSSLADRQKHHKEISFNWRKDKGPQGPQLLYQDSYAMTSPTLLPIINLPDEKSKSAPLESHYHLCPPISPAIPPDVERMIKKLQDDNKLLEEKNKRIENTLTSIEECMRNLMLPKDN